MASTPRTKSKSTGRFTPDQIQMILRQGNVSSVADIQSALHEIFGQALQSMLEGELDHHLGYTKNDTDGRSISGTSNRRNGHDTKRIRSTYGESELTVPRDRDGNFDPTIVRKRQTSVAGIDDQILALYAKGVTTRDIQDHLHEIYGIDVSPTLISHVTDRILPMLREWQSRPLAPVYALMFLDAIHFNVRQDSMICKKAAYVVIGVDLDGMKDVLGLWIGEAESAKFWLTVMTEIAARGTKDILICCTDNLTGFSEAIEAVFPRAQVQKCIIHQLRNSTKYVSTKDRKDVTDALRSIYTAPTELAGRAALDTFQATWGHRYPLVVASWRKNWTELAVFFQFGPEIRRLIYTTNVIESFHRQLRKTTKTKGMFPTDDALLKSLYLTTIDVQKKWTRRIPHWEQILSQLTIMYGERVKLTN